MLLPTDFFNEQLLSGSACSMGIKLDFAIYRFIALYGFLPNQNGRFTKKLYRRFHSCAFPNARGSFER